MILLRVTSIVALGAAVRMVADGEYGFAAFMVFLAIMAYVNGVILAGGLRQLDL